MHSHKCRYCEEDFLCAAARDLCFRNWITCGDCFRRRELKWFFLSFLLAAVACVLTILLFRLQILD
jgi:hypothetical protein